MSIFSNFLKLFKYEPTTDAQNTFNIQTALNDNWDKVDTFAKGVSQQLEDKADVPITIGGNSNIRLIGEIQNYTINKTFNLDAVLYNMYLHYNADSSASLLTTAFLKLGNYGNDFNIEGKLKFLDDFTLGVYKSKIQVASTGKIYAVNHSFGDSFRWQINNKSSNIVIYDNPAVVSTIEGNVIWDSELNKTTITTESDLMANDLIKLTASMNIYVATTGNDTTGDGTSAKPFATIQKAIDSVPKNLGNYSVNIILSSGTYSGFSVVNINNGFLNIKGDTTTTANYIVSGEVIVTSSTRVSLDNLTFNAGVYLRNNTVANIIYCIFTANTNTYGIAIEKGANINLASSSITNRNNGVQIAEACYLSVYNTTISNCIIGINAGVNSGTSSIVTTNACTLTSNTNNYVANYGSVIIDNGTPINSSPLNHESTGTDYGIGTIDNYGHVKVCDDVITNLYNGVALSAAKGKFLNDTKAPNHQSGTTAPSVFVGEGVLYGVHS